MTARLRCGYSLFAAEPQETYGEEMDLILTVVECPPHANMLNHTKVFRSAGGSVGRADSNDWVLPDTERILSSRHLEVVFADGRFSLLDHSTNGTFVNDSQDPLGPGKPHPLAAGDVLICGEYQLQVTLKAPPAEPAIPADLGSADFLDKGDRTTFNPATAAKQQSANSASQLDSWLEPGAQTPKQPEQDWGAVVSQSVGSAKDDPWGSSSSDDSLFGGSFGSSSSGNDPLAALNKPAFSDPAPSSSGWDDNDDWWKSGSASDHAPVEQQNIRIPRPEAPVQLAPQSQHSQTTDPFASDSFASDSFASSSPASEPNPFAASEAVAGGADDIDSLFGIPASPEKPQTTPPAFSSFPDSQQVPPVPESQIPEPIPAASRQGQAAFGAGQPGSGSAQAASGAGTSSVDVRQLASLMGLNNISDDQLDSLMPEVSGIVNEAVTRLIDLLRARTAIKNELRVQHTMIQTVDNNPLKFSANAEDALKMMFSRDASAFMRPQDAVRDSFDDLSDHQVAVLKGMHAAYDTMFKHFDPDNLKQHINTRDSLLGNKDAKNWLAFEQYFKALKSDYETTYNQLFGEEFARAYEKQLAELKNTRALNRT